MSMRVEQPNVLVHLGIQRDKIRAFVDVAVMARPAKVVEIIGAAMLTSNDVLGVKAVKRIVVLVDAAILATTTGTFPNKLAPCGVHYELAFEARIFRAFACKMAITVPAATYDSYSSCSSGVNCPSLHFSANSSMRP
jgi:hypothetical protein